MYIGVYGQDGKKCITNIYIYVNIFIYVNKYEGRGRGEGSGVCKIDGKNV